MKTPRISFGAFLNDGSAPDQPIKTGMFSSRINMIPLEQAGHFGPDDLRLDYWKCGNCSRCNHARPK